MTPGLVAYLTKAGPFVMAFCGAWLAAGGGRWQGPVGAGLVFAAVVWLHA